MSRYFIKLLGLFVAVFFGMAGCGGGGGGSGTPAPITPGNVSISTVSGTASEGALITGKTVKLKDANGKSAIDGTTNTTTGIYSIAVTGLTAPFLVTVTGTNGTYVSLAPSAGTANINPITTVVVALAAGSSDISALFTNLTHAQLFTINTNYSAKSTLVSTSLQAALPAGVKAEDYFTRTITAGKGMDAVFDTYQIAVHPTAGITVKTKDASATTVLTIPVTTVIANTTQPLPTIVAPTLPTSTPTLKLTSIAITPGNPSIAAGFTKQFIATGTNSDGTSGMMTAGIIWSSSNTTAATINASGLATGLVGGSSTISATLGTISGSTALAVTTAVLQSIAVTFENPSTVTGVTKQQATAKGIYSDTSTADITLGVVWSSGTTSVATVSSSGLASYSAIATGITAGTSTITAALGSISGNGIITVPELQFIVVAPANQNLPINQTQQMIATGQYSSGISRDITDSVSWSFYGKTTGAFQWDVLQYMGNGQAKGLLSGTASASASVFAASGSVSGSTSIYVIP